MTTFNRDFDHMLEVLYGWMDASSLVKRVPVTTGTDDDVDPDNILAGRVGHLETDGFHLGADDNGAAMPLFLASSYSDLDVDNTGVDPDGNDIWTAVNPNDLLLTLPATGGYEMQTTEFDNTQTYSVNTYLTAMPSSAATVGKLTPGTLYEDWIVGICSAHEGSKTYTKGTSKFDACYTSTTGTWASATCGPLGYNANGKAVLTFWSYFLPAYPAN